MLDQFSSKLSMISQGIIKLIDSLQAENTVETSVAKQMSIANIIELLHQFIAALDSDHDEASQIIASIRIDDDQTLLDIENSMAMFDTDTARELSIGWIKQHQQ